MALRHVADSYGVALSWETVVSGGEVNLQALLVDFNGTIVDAVSYQRASSFGDAVIHAKDTADGAKDGYNELIWVKTQHLPAHVGLIMFVVGIHGALMKVVSGTITLFDMCGPVAKLPLQQTHGCVDCVAAMKRSGDVWNFHQMESLAELGHTFMDILEPTIGDVIRRHIPGAPRQVQVAFYADVDKAHDVHVPLPWSEDKLCVAVGWEAISQDCYGANLGVAAVFFNSRGYECGSVSSLDEEGFGAKHCTDNPQGGGDDEWITIEMSKVPAEVVQVFFVVNVRTPGFDLSTAQGGFSRIAGGSGKDLVRCNFAEDLERKPGQIFGRLIRTASRWSVQTLAEYCSGRTWMSAVQIMRKLFQDYVLEVETRASSGPTACSSNSKTAGSQGSHRIQRGTARQRAAMLKTRSVRARLLISL